MRFMETHETTTMKLPMWGRGRIPSSARLSSMTESVAEGVRSELRLCRVERSALLGLAGEGTRAYPRTMMAGSELPNSGSAGSNLGWIRSRR